jgi:hypothetical protein
MLRFRIEEKANTSNFKERIVHIHNTPPKVVIPFPVITIQSGLTETSTGSKIYDCKTKDCSVNFTAEKTFTGGILESNFDCRWNFSS